MRIAMLTYADLTGKRDAEAEFAKITGACNVPGFRALMVTGYRQGLRRLQKPSCVFRQAEEAVRIPCR